MELFQELFSALNKAQVKYMLAGGVAVNLYGIERATADIDIVMLLEEKNLKRFVKAAKVLGLKPKLPVKLEDFIDHGKRKSWVRDKGMMVFSLLNPKNPFFIVDILTELTIDFNEAFRRRRKFSVGRTIIPVVPPDILIKMKEGTGRPQDRADVYYLKRIIKGFIDE